MDLISAPPVIRARCPIGPERVLEYNLFYITRDEQMPEVLEWARRQRALGLDIETDGMAPKKKRVKGEFYVPPDGLNFRTKKIATIQIGNPRGPDPRAYVLCIRSLSDEALAPLWAILEDPQVVKLGQNIRFELQWIFFRWGVMPQNVADCQLAEQIIRAGLFSLAADKADTGEASRKPYTESSMFKLGIRYLNIEIEKGEDVRLKFWVTPPKKLNRRQLEYAAGDVIYPFLIAEEQKKEIQARGLKEIVQIEFELLPILVDTEVFGMGIDRSGWMKLWQEAVTKAAEAKRRLDDVFRPQSPQNELFDLMVDGETFGELQKDGTRKAPKREAGKVRPTAGQARKRAPKDVNYNSPPQALAAIKRYCQSIKWTHELVTTKVRLFQLKEQYGQVWLASAQDREAKKVRRNPKYQPREFTAENIPEYVVPEELYCVLVKKKKNKWSASLDGNSLILAKLRKQLPADLVDLYLEYKEYMKLAGTYGQKFLAEQVHPETGRVHVYFHQAITATGRLSSVPNLQNIPRIREYRACFRPKPGNKFVILDYSKIEPRLSAEVSGDPVYVQTFASNLDIYCEIGSAMSGKLVTKKDKALRQGFKSVVLGTAYNMGPGKLRDDMTLKLADFILSGEVPLPSFMETRETLKRYFETVPGIKEYQNQCIAFAAPTEDDVPVRADGSTYPTRPKLWDRYVNDGVTWVAGPCGRKRFFPPTTKTTYTESPNAPIQGCSATITKLATVLIWRACRALGIEVHFVNMVHDELVIECSEANAPRVLEIAKREMEAAAARYIKRVPVIAEVPEGTDGICDYWFKAA